MRRCARHGQSPVVPPAERLEDFADDVHALLAQRDFAPCAVSDSRSGHGRADPALRHPEDVSALVPCACPCTIAEGAARLYAERAATAERDGMAAVLDATLARWFTDAFRAGGGAETARERLLTDDVHGWAHAWRAMAKIDTAPHLHEIRVPTLCIAGALDKSSPPETVAAIARAIPVRSSRRSLARRTCCSSNSRKRWRERSSPSWTGCLESTETADGWEPG